MTQSTLTIHPGATSGIDVGAEIEGATRFLADYLAGARLDRYVIGISGGIDSAVVAMLAARAVGPERLLLVSMPYGLERRPRWAPSAQASLDDARLLAGAIPGAPFVVVDIAPQVDTAAAELGMAAAKLARDDRADLADPWTRGPEDALSAMVLGNLKARMRAVQLRTFANMYRGLVLGTENRTEHWLGYFTIGGDEESDLEVMSPYLKRDVRALAAALGVPGPILDKAPSADLWSGQTDEGELGFTYHDADAVLAVLALAGAGETRDAAEMRIAEATGIAAATVRRVLARIDATAYKRAARPTYRGVAAQEG